MNNPTTDFEEWLDSLGLNNDSPETNTQAEPIVVASDTTSSVPQVADEGHFHLPDRTINAPIIQEEVPPTPEIQSVSFSEEDMDSLLAENGFTESQYDEAEEVQDADFEGESEEEEEDNTEEYNENVGEGRDLDAEEDGDWDENIASGNIIPITVEESTIETVIEPVLNTDANALNTMATVPSESSEDSNPPLLPENSPTVSIDDSTSRFSGTEWYDEMLTKTIMIAGCGGIGSNLAYQIARLKPYSLILYDDDTVELANMSGQLFKRSDVGNKKVSAVHDMISQYTNIYNVRAISRRFAEFTNPTDIMMCGFDSMRARKIYYNAWKTHLDNIRSDRRKDCFFMDGRLTIDTLQVFCLTGEDTYNMDRYEREFLFDDSQADSEVCSQKQTTYLACMIGSIMTNLFINWVANSLDPIIPYKLPFFTQYEAQHMIFKTEE